MFLSHIYANFLHPVLSWQSVHLDYRLFYIYSPVHSESLLLLHNQTTFRLHSSDYSLLQTPHSLHFYETAYNTVQNDIFQMNPPDKIQHSNNLSQYIFPSNDVDSLQSLADKSDNLHIHISENPPYDSVSKTLCPQTCIFSVETTFLSLSNYDCVFS